MQQEKGPKCDHSYVCVEESGDFGEIKVLTALSSSQITIAKFFPDQAEKMCPHGIIRCKKCLESLSKDKQSTSAFPDTKVLLAKLKRS